MTIQKQPKILYNKNQGKRNFEKDNSTLKNMRRGRVIRYSLSATPIALLATVIPHQLEQSIN